MIINLPGHMVTRGNDVLTLPPLPDGGELERGHF